MILLDTNVLSEFTKPVPETKVEHWLLLNESDCCICSTTIGEIAYGIAKFNAGTKKAMLQRQLTEWRLMYADRTHVFAASTAMIYGDIQAKARRAGLPMSVPDAQIAAVAVEHRLALATRNVGDFSTCGLPIIDPWHT